ncbi:MAG: hypothetical protein KC983_02725 [Phycisphaerales bacterium]|nr:hypothetical protein [Phycisphaerales bacterium]
MGSPRERQRNNVRAGLFVTITLLIAMGIVFALTDIKDVFLTSRHAYRVTYTVESGVKSLSPGSQVRIGGLPVGRVKDVALTGGG